MAVGSRTKADLHALVDALPESEHQAAGHFLEYLRDRAIPDDDPVLRAFEDAPEDDEPLTPEDEAAIEEGRAEFAAGLGIPLEEVRREFGW